MAFIAPSPSDPALADSAKTPLGGFTAGNLAGKINDQDTAVEDKAQRVGALLELLGTQIGAGAVTGGTIAPGTGLTVTITAGKAFIPTYVEWNATEIVLVIASKTSNIYLRQDNTWTVIANDASPNYPTDISTHGSYFLWGTATAGASTVSAVSNTRTSWAANILANIANGSLALSKLAAGGAANTNVLAYSSGTGTWGPVAAGTPGAHNTTHFAATGSDPLTAANVGAAPAVHTHVLEDITDMLSSMPPTAHNSTHHYSTGSDPITYSMVGAAAAVHNHNSDYYLQATVDSLLAGKASGGHTHAWNSITGKIGGFAVPLGDGVNVISVGSYLDVRMPYNLVISRVSLMSDVSGSMVVDLRVDTWGNYPPTSADSICASAKPTLSSASKAEDTTLTGWTTSVAEGTVVRIYVESCSSIHQATLEIKGTKS